MRVTGGEKGLRQIERGHVVWRRVYLSSVTHEDHDTGQKAADTLISFVFALKCLLGNTFLHHPVQNGISHHPLP